MKRYLTILFFFLLSLTLSAQQPKMNVTLFRQSSEQTANLAGTMVRDNDGKPCALLRVQTTQKGFNWQFGQFNAVKVDESHTAEIWVYVPYGVKRCTIRHPQLGTCDYDFPMAVESAKTYRMDLAVADINVVVTQKLSQAYFLLKIKPSDSGTHVQFGATKDLEMGEMSRVADEGSYSVFSERLDCGKYWYKVENHYFDTHSGTFEVTRDKENTHIVSLVPHFGLLTVITEPSGADVFLDNEPVGQSPCLLTRRLTPGEHSVRCVYADYYPQNQTVVIPSDGMRIEHRTVLKPQFAEVTITAADPLSEIWIDGEKVAAGKWTGRLSSKFSHYVESRLNGHLPQSKVIEVKDGVPQTISIEAPVPVYGSLDLQVNNEEGEVMPGADVFIDGKKTGTTPYLGEILAGSHTVTVCKAGYADLNTTVDIQQNKETPVSLTMTKQSAAPATVVSPSAQAVPAVVPTDEYYSDGRIGAYEYVDLGLSVKWATCNIGASKPEEYGKYYAWGDVKGQTLDGWKWSGGGFQNKPAYKLNSLNNLLPEYDAANVNWGGNWRMPTAAEFEELINNCKSEWTTLKGIAGRKFTSRKPGYTDRYIFFPFAGEGMDSSLALAGGFIGFYWSGTFRDGKAMRLYIYQVEASVDSGNRNFGLSVRPVIK